MIKEECILHKGPLQLGCLLVMTGKEKCVHNVELRRR